MCYTYYQKTSKGLGREEKEEDRRRSTYYYISILIDSKKGCNQTQSVSEANTSRKRSRKFPILVGEFLAHSVLLQSPFQKRVHRIFWTHLFSGSIFIELTTLYKSRGKVERFLPIVILV